MQSSLVRLAFMAALGGLSNAMILAAINAGAQVSERSNKAALWGTGLFLLGRLFA